MKKEVLKLLEYVRIKGTDVLGRVDTGARRCSIDKKLAEQLKLGPVITNRKYRSASGRSERPVVEEEITIKGKTMKVKINITDRAHMKYSFLIGREALKNGFLIDPGK